MELIIKRAQDKGLIGGIKFVLEAKVSLTDQETELVKKYKANKQVLYSSANRTYTIDDLLFGVKDKVKDVSVLLNNEAIYFEACEYLKSLLEVMSTFGGELHYQFKKDGVYNAAGEKIK